MGNQDGYFGAWMFAIYEKQILNSISQLTQGVANVGSSQAKCQWLRWDYGITGVALSTGTAFDQ